MPNLSQLMPEEKQTRAMVLAAVLMTQAGNVAYDRFFTEGRTESLKREQDDRTLSEKIDRVKETFDTRMSDLQNQLWNLKYECKDTSNKCARLEKRIERGDK